MSMTTTGLVVDGAELAFAPLITLLKVKITPVVHLTNLLVQEEEKEDGVTVEGVKLPKT